MPSQCFMCSIVIVNRKRDNKGVKKLHWIQQLISFHTYTSCQATFSEFFIKVFTEL